MQPELNARSSRLNRSRDGVSCRNTKCSFGNMNLMRPSAFVGPGRWRSMYGKFFGVTLAQSIVAGSTTRPRAIDDVHALLVEIAAIALDRRQRVVAQDRRRHGPVRIDHEIRHVGAEDRRRAIRFADHRARRPLHAGRRRSSTPDSRRCSRRRSAACVRPAPTATVRDSRAAGRRERCADTLISISVCAPTTPSAPSPWWVWNVAHGVGERLIERVGVAGGRRGEVLRRESQPQRADARIDAARLQRRPGRHFVPTAGGDVAAIAGEHASQRFVHRTVPDFHVESARRDRARR